MVHGIIEVRAVAPMTQLDAEEHTIDLEDGNDFTEVVIDIKSELRLS